MLLLPVLPRIEQPKTGNISAVYANVFSCSSSALDMICLKNIMKRVGGLTQTVVLNLNSHAAIHLS